MKIALLISGGGTTAARIISECRPGGRLEGIEPVLVIASRPDAGGIQKALDLGLNKNDVIVLERSRFPTPGTFGSAIIHECEKRGVEFVGQYGWMVLTPANVIERYHGMMTNQHPGPLDIGREDFGGAGMFGMRVHAARLCFVQKTGRDFWSEATAQRVETNFDKGAVIKAEKVVILPDDTPESLAERMLPIEHEVQIQALTDILHNGVREMHCEYPLVNPEEIEILERCKKEAILRYPKG
jgi:phosphoribosylglycinamide formyltransferase-1